MGEILVIGACVYYLIKKQSVDGWLMTTGSFFTFSLSVFSTFIFPFIVAKKTIEAEILTGLYQVFYVAGVFFHLIFGIGFLLLIIKYAKTL